MLHSTLSTHSEAHQLSRVVSNVNAKSRTNNPTRTFYLFEFIFNIR